MSPRFTIAASLRLRAAESGHAPPRLAGQRKNLLSAPGQRTGFLQSPARNEKPQNSTFSIVIQHGPVPQPDPSCGGIHVCQRGNAMNAMNAFSEAVSPPEALQRIRAQAAQAGLAYAGDVPPDLAWALAEAGEAVLIDVRSPEEIRFVGHVPGAAQVPWATGIELARNPRFLRALEAAAPRSAVILLLCRSGQRSAFAAAAATAAGFAQVFNILEGFEGDLDASGRRGRTSGWQARDLPWRHD